MGHSPHPDAREDPPANHHPMATEKQIRANQLTARKSTGPRTEEGKAQSRRNALKHGLAGARVVLPEDEEAAVRARAAEWHSSLKPSNAYELWLAERIAVASIRIERCEWLERERRKRLADRALDDWEEDRRIAAEKLGANLAHDPCAVALALQQTSQGCDWLLERWHRLVRALDYNGGWTDDQRRLALDMLGMARELRDGIMPLVPEHDKEALLARKSAVRKEIRRLERREEVLDARDLAEQRAVVAGEAAEADTDLALLRRYEAACHRGQQWALKQLKEGRHGVNTHHLPLPTTPSPPALDENSLPPVSGGAPGPEEEAPPRTVEEPPRAIAGRAPGRPETADTPSRDVPTLTSRRGLNDFVFGPSPGEGNRRPRRAQRRLERKA